MYLLHNVQNIKCKYGFKYGLSANIQRYYTGQQLISQLCQRTVKRQLKEPYVGNVFQLFIKWP